MKIVTWNCNGGFDRKVGRIAALGPDIAVIPECTRPRALAARGSTATPAAWEGTSQEGSGHVNDGVGLFTFTGLECARYEGHDPSIKWALPVRVTGWYSFNLLALWVKPAATEEHDRSCRYLRQIEKALDTYSAFIAERDTVVLGDFNTSSAFAPGPRLTHDGLVTRLAERGLYSAYHAHHNTAAHGAEAHKTHRHRRSKSAWHIDYCFIPLDWLPRLRSVEVGRFEEWLSAPSDHAPVIVDLAL